MLRYLTLVIIFFIGTVIANSVEPCGVLHNVICLLAGALGAYSYILFSKK